MVPARYFVDGERQKENVVLNEMVCVPDVDRDIPISEAELLPLERDTTPAKCLLSCKRFVIIGIHWMQE